MGDDLTSVDPNGALDMATRTGPYSLNFLNNAAQMIQKIDDARDQYKLIPMDIKIDQNKTNTTYMGPIDTVEYIIGPKQGQSYMKTVPIKYFIPWSGYYL